MPTVPLRLAGRTYESQSRFQANERTVNWYPEIDDSGNGVSQITMYPTPGLVSWMDKSADSGSGRCRGQLIWDEGSKLIVVLGENVYSVTAAGVGTQVGTIPDDGKQVWMTANLLDQIAIFSDNKLYLCNGSTTAQVTDPDLPSVICGAFVDQYLLALRADSQQFFIPSLADWTAWDALDFTTIETAEDKQRVAFAVRREPWFFGNKLTVVYYNSGNADFPFEPRPGTVYQRGIEADHSIAEMDEMLFWLAQTPEGGREVMRASAGSVQVISDHGMAEALANYATVDDAIGFCQKDRKHRFYWLTFPTEKATWVWDDTTRMWHERLYFNTFTGQYEAHRIQTHAYFNSQHIVGDREDGILYTMTQTAFTDAGDTVRRLRRVPHLIKGLRGGQSRQTHRSLRVFCEVGLGLNVASGAAGYNPQLAMRYSNNGGKTWSNERLRSMGKQGEYGTVVEFKRLGSTNTTRQYEVVCTDPVPVRLLSAFLDVD